MNILIYKYTTFSVNNRFNCVVICIYMLYIFMIGLFVDSENYKNPLHKMIFQRIEWVCFCHYHLANHSINLLLFYSLLWERILEFSISIQTSQFLHFVHEFFLSSMEYCEYSNHFLYLP